MAGLQKRPTGRSLPISKAALVRKFASGVAPKSKSYAAAIAYKIRKERRPDVRSGHANAEKVLDRAADILGSQSAATEWMLAKCTWLNGRRPCDLLGTEEGLRRIDAYLGQVEHGVYV